TAGSCASAPNSRSATRCGSSSSSRTPSPCWCLLDTVRLTVARYFEDFAVGLRFRSAGAIAVTADRIKSFGAEVDPQPSHLDEGGARASLFCGLVASGWHTAAISMRLIVDSDLGLSGQGAGVAIESMKWLKHGLPREQLRRAR